LNAILILLGLFSLTILFSNLDFISRAKSFSFLSIPLVLGILCSPDFGLMPLLPSTRDSLSWAVKVVLLWLTFLAGIRLSEKKINIANFQKLLPTYLTYFLFLFLSFIFISFIVFKKGIVTPLFQMDETVTIAVLISLMLSSLIFSTKENPFLLFVFFISLFQWLNPELNFISSYTGLIYPILIGVLLGFVCRLIISTKQDLDTYARLTLLGLCVLGAGWAVSMGLLEVIVGLSLGWTLSLIHKYGICRDPQLKETEPPLLLITAFFAGLFLDLSFETITLGIILCLLRFCIKWSIVWFGLRKMVLIEILTHMIPISSLAIIVSLSLHLSEYRSSQTQFILSTFCIAFIVNDVLALFLELVWGQTSTEDEIT